MSFLDYDPEEITAGPILGNKFEKFNRVEYNQVIDCKLVLNPHFDGPDGKPARVHIFQTYWFEYTKNGKKQRACRPSLKVLGQEDPQDIFCKQIREKQKELKKNGQEISAEYAKLTQLYNKFKPNNNAALLYVVPGGSVISALQVPASVADEIFGKAAFGDKPAIQGLLSKMLSEKRNPFNIKDEVGWIRITKTGTCFNDTKYIVTEVPKVPCKFTTNDGKVVEAYDHFRATVSPEIFKLQKDDIANSVKIASQFSWSADEVTEYLKSKGEKVPDRIVNKPQKETAAEDDTPVVRPMAKASPVSQGIDMSDDQIADMFSEL
jgi:hypothetical protein